MEGMRKVNIKNCASLVQYFSWMEDHLKKNPDSDMTEYTAAKKLEEFRKTRDHYMGPSFDTISSIGPNGAVIHYKPEKTTALKMNNKEIYLLDSGVQYLDGTTDITRTVHFGGAEPTAEQKDRYTRVLLGVLDLERIVWPKGGPYSGSDFDALARRHLWADGVDYKHGTGHGVGSFNCVHEGPQGIHRRSAVKLEVGMCVSNEPGFYKDGEYGIRIENVIMVNNHSKFDDRLIFENLTFCPYSRELLDLNLLSNNDKQYLNNFNKRVSVISF
jgi:Xaa-Pro aminopeptidase